MPGPNREQDGLEERRGTSRWPWNYLLGHAPRPCALGGGRQIRPLDLLVSPLRCPARHLPRAELGMSSELALLWPTASVRGVAREARPRGASRERPAAQLHEPRTRHLHLGVPGAGPRSCRPTVDVFFDAVAGRDHPWVFCPRAQSPLTRSPRTKNCGRERIDDAEALVFGRARPNEYALPFFHGAPWRPRRPQPPSASFNVEAAVTLLRQRLVERTGCCPRVCRFTVFVSSLRLRPLWRVPGASFPRVRSLEKIESNAW